MRLFSLFQRLRLLAFLLATAVVLSACSSVPTTIVSAHMPLAMFRLPITYDSGIKSEPLSDEDARRLKTTAATAASSINRLQAIQTYWSSPDKTRPQSNDGGRLADEFDSLQDLTEADTIVFVTLSGGGTRAVSLASHALSLIEKRFNELTAALGFPRETAMLHRINAFSTVSGGSLYAYQLLRMKTTVDVMKADHASNRISMPFSGERIVIPKPKLGAADPTRHCRSGQTDETAYDMLDLERCFFQFLQPHVENGAMRVGYWGAIYYHLPYNFLGLAPLFTDNNYLDVLAGGLAISGGPLPDSLEKKVTPGALRMGDMSSEPRIFFNTTALQTGLPLVITQRLMHLRTEPVERTARLDLGLKDPHQPLGVASTLEEMNSSPANFPVAYAAMASAAFPIGLDPLKIGKYPMINDSPTRSRDYLQLSDGGIYDNSGLTTVTSLAKYLTSDDVHKGVDKGERNFIFLSINADNEDYDASYLQRGEPERFPWKLITFGFPFRWDALGQKAIELMHFTNKRRAEQLAVRDIQALIGSESKAPKEGRGQVYFFPVSLSQFSISDGHQILIHEADRPVDTKAKKEKADLFFKKLMNVPTRYLLTSDDDELMAQAAKEIVTAKQSPGWQVRIPQCGESVQTVQRLDEAFVLAVLSRDRDWARIGKERIRTALGPLCEP